MARLTAIILAAGQGKRMKNALPKVLHPIAGRPMLTRVIRCVKDLGADEVRVVTGHGADLVNPLVIQMGAIPFRQDRQLGTGHAVSCANPGDIEGQVLILNGDHPLIETRDLQVCREIFEKLGYDLAVISVMMKDPGNYGRIVRHKGHLAAIVEAKDASAEARKINEVNTGIFVLSADVLKEYLPKLGKVNAQGEYYLTDLVELCRQNGKKIGAIEAPQHVGFGVNSQKELAQATKKAFRRKIKELMEEGVIVVDPKSTYIEDEVQVGAGSVLYPGVFLRGSTRVGERTVIEPQVYIEDSLVGSDVKLKAGSYIEKSVVGDRAQVGPYAHLRPDTKLGEEAQIGNFVELKNVNFGAKSKAAHLSYLGDADIGDDTNIGCGTITCNYAVDKKKYRTKIGRGVFVGSDTQFVAPIEVGDGAVIGSGSTITKDVPAEALAVARGRQVNLDGWSTKKKKEK